MINTYQTSMAPPPVPPRLSGSHSVLIPGPLPSQGHSKSLVRFIVGVVLMHLFLSIGGFIYLYHNDKMHSFQPPLEKGVEGRVDYHSSEKQETSYKALASLIVDQKSGTSSLSYLQWDFNHSDLRYIDYYQKSWLTIREPGDYYVYSRVTFSKGDPELPLVSKVMLRKYKTEKEKVVMQAYCNLNNGSASIPRLCTATQGQVIKLEKGSQLGVWVKNLLLVNYEDGATTFGMYKL